MSHVVVYSKEYLQEVWEHGIRVNGSDPGVWQKDTCDAWIKRGEYGKKSEHGWRVDHSNHRPIQWENHEKSLEEGNHSCAVTASSEDKKNERAN